MILPGILLFPSLLAKRDISRGGGGNLTSEPVIYLLFGSDMISSHLFTRFDILQLGPLNRAEVENAEGLANQTQTVFHFDFNSDRVPLPRKYRRLKNGGYDLDTIVEDLLQRDSLSEPTVFFTNVPYSDREHQNDPNYFYFMDEGDYQGIPLAIVSTYLWRQLQSNHSLQTYVLLSLAALALRYAANL